MELHVHFPHLKYIIFVTTSTSNYSVYEYRGYVVLSGQVTIAVSHFIGISQKSKLRQRSRWLTQVNQVKIQLNLKSRQRLVALRTMSEGVLY